MLSGLGEFPRHNEEVQEQQYSVQIDGHFKKVCSNVQNCFHFGFDVLCSHIIDIVNIK